MSGSLFDRPEAEYVVLRVHHDPLDGKDSVRVIAERASTSGKVVASKVVYRHLLKDEAIAQAVLRAVDAALSDLSCTVEDL